MKYKLTAVNLSDDGGYVATVTATSNRVTAVFKIKINAPEPRQSRRGPWKHYQKRLEDLDNTAADLLARFCEDLTWFLEKRQPLPQGPSN